MESNKTYVTQACLPPINEFFDKIKPIWESKHLTNFGAIHEEFKGNLKEYLHVENLSLFTNGHLALEVAIKVLKLPKGGEIITTPFTFVSTSHAILNCGYKPVFCDINPNDCNINVDKIEELITKETVAILPVHVFGQPCNVDRIQAIAQKHNLKVIYDSAHAFGVEINNKSLLNYGDISMISLHATKVMNSIEGGVLVYKNQNLTYDIRCLKNFGITSPEDIPEVGLNAKMNEFQAAMGILNLQYLDENIEKRKKIFNLYLENFKPIQEIQTLTIADNVKYNYSYFPIVLTTDKVSRNSIVEELHKHNIVPRKYFYPLISNLDNYKDYKHSSNNLKVANNIANNILTIPIYPDLDLQTVDNICTIIENFLRKKEI